jgi:hypothetical protein
MIAVVGWSNSGTILNNVLAEQARPRAISRKLHCDLPLLELRWISARAR